MVNSTSPRKPGRPRDPELRALRRAQILDSAARVFAERGYAKTDVDAVAKRAGVAKGTIYQYFRSKSALFLAAVDDCMKQLSRSTEAARENNDDPLEKIWQAVRSYLQFFDENQHFVELLIQERAQFKDRKKPTYFVYRDANRGPWNELLADLIRSGRLRRVPVDRIINVVGDLLYGTMFTNYFAGRRQSVDEQFRDVVDIIRHGILSDNERSKGLKLS